MSVQDMTEGRQDIFSMLFAAYTDFDKTGFNYPVNILFEGREIPDGSPKDPAQAYLDAYVIPAYSQQASLANHDGVRRWESKGTIWVRCYAPLQDGAGLENAEKLCKIPINAYRGRKSPLGTWFRNVRPDKVGPSEGWYLITMLIDYEFDEIG